MDYNKQHHKEDELLYTWKLEGKKLCPDSVKEVKFDFLKKIIYFEAFETVDGYDVDLHTWLESDIERETLRFTTYCEFGKPIYEYNMNGLNVLENISGEFSNIRPAYSTRKLAISYNEFNRRSFRKGKGNSIYTICLAGDKAEFELIPLISIIVHKGNIREVSLKIPKPDCIELKLINDLVSGLKPTLILNEYNKIEEQAIRSITLDKCELLNIKHECENLLNSYDILIKCEINDWGRNEYRHKC